MSWRFVNTGLRGGAFNMCYDEFLALQLLEGKGSATIRVYGWDPAAISLGFHQSESDIDGERCRFEGVDVVRRPTGGRAILHAHEVTYSVVMPAAGSSIAEAYHYVGAGLLAALGYLGVAAEMAKDSLNLSNFYRENIVVSCFASTSRYEIQYRGKKIIGSAQRRYASPQFPGRDVVLQHGSILLGTHHRKLMDYVASSQLRTREILRNVLEHKTIEVESIVNRPVSFDEAADAVRRGFETAWGITLCADDLSDAECETVPDENAGLTGTLFSQSFCRA